jgi:hypothetical protein
LSVLGVEEQPSSPQGQTAFDRTEARAVRCGVKCFNPMNDLKALDSNLNGSIPAVDQKFYPIINS